MREQLRRVGSVCSALCAAGLVLGMLACGARAQAQTLKERLKEQVREGIDESREKPKDKPAARAPEEEPAAKPKPKPSPAPKSDQKPDVRFTLADVIAPPEKPRDPNAPKLPVRVLGEHLRLDIKLGAGYRGWYPQQYDAVDVDVGNYATWMIEGKARLFKFLNLRRGYYESNGLAGPRTEEAAVAAKIGSYAPKAAWVLGVIGIPITKAWEPVIRYESRAFETRAKPRRDVCVVARDAPEDAMESCPGTMGELKIISGFETLILGVRYDHSRTSSPVITERVGKIPPIYVGAGLMQYRKPYQLTVDGTTFDEFLFDARFRGAGLAGGAEIGGGLDRFFGDVDLQIGLGEVSLTDSITLNELVPSDHMIGYIQGSASLGYRWPMIRAAPTLILVPSVELGGASFFMFDTKVNEDEDAKTLPVNWDLLWTVQLSLLVPL